MKEIKQRSTINAAVDMPGSKSITHRAVIAASLASGWSRLENYLVCEDTLYTISTLQELGVHLDVDEDALVIQGNEGVFPEAPTSREFYLGNSGTSLRLLLSVAALAHGEWVLTGTPRMQQRPIGELVDSLRMLGVDTHCLNNDGCPPVLVRGTGRIKGGKTRARGEKSSQFLSSLLLVAPCTLTGMEIEVEGPLVSSPYVELTLEIMNRFGVHVDHSDLRRFQVNTEQKYQGRSFEIEGDASSASYFGAAAAVTGGRIEIKNIRGEFRQADLGFLEILESMGCRVKRTSFGVSVEGGSALKGVEVDMNEMPDLVPTLAVLALFAEGKTFIRNIGHLRYKESDRLHGLAGELRRLGGEVEERDNGLLITGGGKLHGAEVETYHDHRLAMSFAVAGLRVPGVRILNEECVNKSFPQFWRLWDRL
jgi:3-phosphoshikimate 1-carboxyvinyltransferase